MLNRILEFSLGNRFLIIVITLLLIVGGVISMLRLPVDAVPDVTPNQVQILTNSPGLGPVEVYARVGAVQYDLEKTASGLKTEFDGTAPQYGIGASLKIFSLGARAEYEVMDVDELEKSDTVWLSVFYQF